MSKYDIPKYKKGDKVWIDNVGEGRVPGVVVGVDKKMNLVIVRNVGKLNKQGYNMSRPYAKNVTLLTPRKTKLR